MMIATLILAGLGLAAVFSAVGTARFMKSRRDPEYLQQAAYVRATQYPPRGWELCLVLIISFGMVAMLALGMRLRAGGVGAIEAAIYAIIIGAGLIAFVIRRLIFKH